MSRLTLVPPLVEVQTPREPQLVTDPRRPGRAMMLVWCWCGRFFTVTPENIMRCGMNAENPCPNPTCGLGEE